jgi:hypothetical protein
MNPEMFVEKHDDYPATVLADEAFEHFVEVCEKSSEPNRALRDAFCSTRERGFLDPPEEGASHS